MSDRRRGLGRGLGALIPAGPAPVTDANPPAAARATTPSPVDVLIPGRSIIAHRPPADPERPTLRDDAARRLAGDQGHPAPPGELVDSGDPGTGRATAGDLVARFAEIPVEAVTRNPRQPRQVFDEEELAELARSIQAVGLLQPIVVRPAGPDRFELVMGERRWLACREAGMDRVPAIVRSTGDEALLRDALLENLHRAQLNALEEAAAYDPLLRDFGCTPDELATRRGRSRPQITNTLRLLRLPPGVQRRVAAGVLSAGHARALLALDDGGVQERLARRIVAEGLSVRAVEEMVAMGDVPGEARRRRQAGAPRAPGLIEVAARLADRFETRVQVGLGRSKGKIVVEFASLRDLDRILGLMAPDLPVPTTTTAPTPRPSGDTPAG